jgi:hypothetical protein
MGVFIILVFIILAPNEIVNIADSTIAICTQWGVKNIDRFISRAQEFGYEVPPC